MNHAPGCTLALAVCCGLGLSSASGGPLPRFLELPHGLWLSAKSQDIYGKNPRGSCIALNNLVLEVTYCNLSQTHKASPEAWGMSLGLTSQSQESQRRMCAWICSCRLIGKTDSVTDTFMCDRSDRKSDLIWKKEVTM